MTAIDSLKEDYQRVETKIIAYNWNGEWVNVASQFVLSPGLWKFPYPHMKSLAKISELYLLRDTLPIGELDRVFDIFKKGEFSAGPNTVLYKRWSGKWDSAYAPSFSALERGESETWLESETFAYAVRGGETGMQQFAGSEGLRRIESKLAALRTPFVNLTDFATDFIGRLPVQNVWGYPSAEIMVPIRVKFVLPSQVDDGKAQYRFEMQKGFKKSLTSVGFATFSGDRAYSRGRTTHFELVKETSRTLRYQGVVKFPSAAQIMTLLLTYRGDNVDRQSLHRPIIAGENVRMVAYERSDPGLEKFAAGLAPEDRKARTFFEESVRLLFSFMGFSCLKPPTQDSVDIIAFTDDPSQILIIECTTETPGLRDKLSKLSARRTLYKKAMPSKLLAIVITSLPRGDISNVDQQRATREGLILIGKEEIRDLVEMGSSRPFYWLCSQLFATSRTSRAFR